jgi:RNA recognition motif-containing protein
MHDNACLIISNLAHQTTEAELKALFKPFGFIFCVKITEGTYDQLNTATIQFMKESMAIESIKKMHGKEINGEKI